MILSENPESDWACDFRLRCSDLVVFVLCSDWSEEVGTFTKISQNRQFGNVLFGGLWQLVSCRSRNVRIGKARLRSVCFLRYGLQSTEMDSVYEFTSSSFIYFSFLITLLVSVDLNAFFSPNTLVRLFPAPVSLSKERIFQWATAFTSRDSSPQSTSNCVVLGKFILILFWKRLSF